MSDGASPRLRRVWRSPGPGGRRRRRRRRREQRALRSLRPRRRRYSVGKPGRTWGAAAPPLSSRRIASQPPRAGRVCPTPKRQPTESRSGSAPRAHPPGNPWVARVIQCY